MDHLEEELICCVCLDFLDNPVILPCSHNLCKKCVQGLFNSRNGVDPSFQCPKCRHVVILSWRETIDKLPENKALKNIITIVKEMRSVSGPARYMCTKHGLNQKYYCHTCKCTICMNCKLESHSGFGHNIEAIDVVLADKQEKAETSVMEMKLAEKSLEDHFEQILDEKAKLKAYTDNLMTSLDSWFDQLHQHLVFKKKELVRALQTLVKDRRKTILSREASCKNKLSSIKSLIKCYEASQDSSCKPEQKVEVIDNLLIRVCSLMTFVLNDDNYELVMEPLPDIRLQGAEATLKELQGIRWSSDMELSSDKRQEKQSGGNKQQAMAAGEAAASADDNKKHIVRKSTSNDKSTGECSSASTQSVKDERSTLFSPEGEASHTNENSCNVDVDNGGNQASGGASNEVPEPPFCATDFFKSFSDPGVTWPSPGQTEENAATQAVQPVGQSSSKFSSPGRSKPQGLQTSFSIDSSQQKPLFTLGSSPPTQRMQKKRTKVAKRH